jgi:hypothetical protein
MPPHAPVPDRGPTRKLRGKRRYFRQVAARAAAFTITPGPGRWWDLWHYHADWPGWGSVRWSYRRQHLAALGVVYATVCRAAPRFTTPFQTWVALSTGAGGDATYVHTPNPNADDFPFVAVDTAWDELRDPELVALFPPGLSLRVGRSTRPSDDEVDRGWLIYSPDVGVPLEAPGAPRA